MNKMKKKHKYINKMRKRKIVPTRHIWRLEVRLHSFLTLKLDGRQWSASCPGSFVPGVPIEYMAQ